MCGLIGVIRSDKLPTATIAQVEPPPRSRGMSSLQGDEVAGPETPEG